MTTEESRLRNDIAVLKTHIALLKKDVQKAKHDIAKEIFKKMYDLVSGETDCTITVNADDVKQIAKRYGVKL